MNCLVDRPFRLGPALALLIPVLGSACASAGRLAEYDFTGRTLALVVDSRPVPEIFDSSPPPIVGMDDEETSRSALARLGSGLLRDVITNDARERLVAAAERIDVAELLGERTLARAARTLRAEPVTEGPADFELEMRITRYGITSTDANGAPRCRAARRGSCRRATPGRTEQGAGELRRR